MVRRSKSSARWLKEHFTDPFVKEAHAQGWRSRAVFKLKEIDRKDKLLRPGMIVLDLGAAPGAWSQYAKQQVGKHGRVVASDILTMEPLAAVEFVQGDFRQEPVFEQLRTLLGPSGADVVLSDMAPNMAGMDVIDQPRSMYLAELAVDMAAQVLKPGGDTLIKTFQGAGFPQLVAAMRGIFEKVKFAKPAASRDRSPELYVVGKTRRPKPVS